MPRAHPRFAGVVRSYVRVSGPDQERIGTSPEAQRAAHLAYCRAHDLPDPVFYVEVESAAESSIELRDEQLRLQREMRPGDLVLVTLLDRWSRDVPHAVSTVRAMIKQGVSWIAFQDAIDASTDQGDWMLVQRAAIAEEERRRIYRRTAGRYALDAAADAGQLVRDAEIARDAAVDRELAAVDVVLGAMRETRRGVRTVRG